MSTTNVRHHRRRRAAWGLAAGVAVATTALGATTTHAQSNEVIKIGLIQTSEGPFANNSGTAAQGAQYAVDLINAAGGVNGRTLELVTADSHGQPEQLATIIPRFVSEENVIAMIGGVESASCDVGCPLAAQFETIYVSPGAPRRARARPSVLVQPRPARCREQHSGARRHRRRDRHHDCRSWSTRHSDGRAGRAVPQRL